MGARVGVVSSRNGTVQLFFKWFLSGRITRTKNERTKNERTNERLEPEFDATGKEKEKHLRFTPNFDHFGGLQPLLLNHQQICGWKKTNLCLTIFSSLIPMHKKMKRPNFDVHNPSHDPSQSVDPWPILYSNLWVLDYPHQNERMSSWKGTISKGMDLFFQLPTSIFSGDMFVSFRGEYRLSNLSVAILLLSLMGNSGIIGLGSQALLANQMKKKSAQQWWWLCIHPWNIWHFEPKVMEVCLVGKWFSRVFNQECDF